jgi:hypothetical protein
LATGDGVWDRFHDRSYPLCEKILSLRATTLAGLAVQARASSLAESELWEDEDRDEEWDDRQRAFIEAVCAFVGVTPVETVS